ncbi:hypothetical protein Glove_621g5 [Diversispora epigaea]|uniref:Tc1-like transposase DDE domain-containing protein n=1 Tax=Diversispora epigaea TaxID=1348612 RepID=A0A397GAK7_9GLOM|nr:hypothetical protein Glove_621g5 [Diversispora epigaea]
MDYRRLEQKPLCNHRVKPTVKFGWGNNDIRVLDWPAQSPDLNPIEASKVWVELGVNECKKLVDTMPTHTNNLRWLTVILGCISWSYDNDESFGVTGNKLEAFLLPPCFDLVFIEIEVELLN